MLNAGGGDTHTKKKAPDTEKLGTHLLSNGPLFGKARGKGQLPRRHAARQLTVAEVGRGAADCTAGAAAPSNPFAREKHKAALEHKFPRAVPVEQGEPFVAFLCWSAYLSRAAGLGKKPVPEQKKSRLKLKKTF